MERRPASTEEEEMNQRRRLLNLARKGDPKAISRLFELYQVRVYSGENLSKVKRLPTMPSSTGHEKRSRSGSKKSAPKRASRQTRGKPVRKVAH